ncbi:MAG: DUF1501 domain-containing protein [Betaproteobacteria bacterium]
MSAIIGTRSGLGSAQRRRWLKTLAASGLLAALERNLAFAQTAPDYKALVAIYLQGGNDGENTLVRYDTAGYANYAAVRSPASGINIPQSQLLPIQPASTTTPFGFHPSCGPLKTLFDQKKLAVVSNVGMLTQPLSKATINAGGQVPANLFSHPDQQLAMQSADASGYTRVGWGGRIADRLSAFNPGVLFPALASTAGQRTFVEGNSTIPLDVGGFSGLFVGGSGQFQFDSLRDAAIREVLSQDSLNTYDAGAQLLATRGLSNASVVAPIINNAQSAVPPYFAIQNTELSRWMQTIAMLIEGRAQTQLKRQVFFINHGGFDTHAGQPFDHETRLRALSQSLKSFYDALAALGMENSVTTFTFSDFGRTFKPATGAGTDHGWGGCNFVVGGAVKGGDFYGTLPEQALGGPDDVTSEGRWIPTTSLEQFAAPLVRWLGIGQADLSYVLPNLGAFPGPPLGFI